MSSPKERRHPCVTTLDTRQLSSSLLRHFSEYLKMEKMPFTPGWFVRTLNEEEYQQDG